MGSVITSKKGLLKLVKGQINIEVDGTNQPAKDGEQLPKGAVLHIGENATYEITFDDGTKLSNEDVPNTATATPPSTASEATLDEIQALQDLIASGEDPTQSLPETAAGNTPGSDGNSGYVTLARSGSETLASSGYSTTGQAPTTIAPNELSQTIATDSPSILANDTNTIDEDTIATGNVLDNDSDADSELTVASFEVEGTSYAAGTEVTLESGVLIINADGSYTFTPSENWNGQVPVITYTTNTGASATLTLNVTPVNDPSIATGDTQGSGAEDAGVISGTLSATDVDGLTNGNVFSITGAAANGTASIDPVTGAWSYTPVADWNGTDSFTVTITDDDGNTTTQVINVTVTPVADIVADTMTTNEDTAVTLNLLANDSFENADAAVTAVTNGANGTVIINADGTVTYTPNANFHGSDSFTYTVTSGGVTETTTVNVTVGQVDDPTTITGDTQGSGAEDAGVISGTLSATDVDGLTNGNVFSITGAAANGTASIDPVTGAWSYTPVADWNGTDSFTVTITDDDGNTTTQVINVTVTPVADIVADTMTTNEDTAVTLNLLANDSFENADAAVTAVTNGANGTVIINADGTVTYTPNANFHGSDSFTYTVTSGGVTETTTVNVTVGQVDDPTTITGDTQGSGAEDAGVISGTLSATDVDGLTNGNVFSITGAAANGTASIDPVTGAWSYTPVADWNGTDSFTVTITDDDGNTTTQVINVTVTPVADIVADTMTTNEDTAVTLNLLANDSFENADAAVTAVTNGANGTVIINADGTVTYTPNANFHGSDSFTYTVTSGGVTETTTVNVTVGQVDDPTTITGDTQGSGAEDAGVISGTLSATDVDGLTNGNVFSITGAAANGTASIDPVTGAWSYTPVADWNGTDSFTVTITDDDGNTTTQVINVTVTPVADIVADTMTTNEDTAVTLNLLANDSFENADAAVTAVTNGANGTVIINADGTVTYTPNANFHGSDSFTYTVTSGGVTETTTVNVTVGQVDDPTTITGDTQGSGAEDAGVISGTLSATDVDGLTNGNVFSITGAAANGTASIDPVTGAWSYTPVADWNGTDSFTVTITDDDGNTTTQVINVTVTPVADIVADTMTTNEDTAVTLNLLANDSFENADAAVTAVTNGANGTVIINADGTVTYTPNANFHGSDSFTYTVTSGGVTETTTVNVTVLDITPPPAPTVWIVDDGVPGDGLLTQSEINSNGVGIQLQVTVSHAELLIGGVVTINVNNGGDLSTYTLKLVDGALLFSDNTSATGFSYNNGVISWTEDVPVAGQNITVTATQTDSTGNTSTQAYDTAEIYQPNNQQITVNESDLRDNIPNVVSSTISFTAGNQALTQFRFNESAINAATNLAAGVSIVWAIAANGALIGSIDGVDVIKLTLTGGVIAAGTTANITVNVELLDNIKHMNALDGTNLNSLINGIVIEAVSADGSVLTGNLSIVINDDLISIDPVSTSGVNSSSAANIIGALNILGADGNDHDLNDDYSISLTANITGWNGTTTTFANSGITSEGLTIFYYVDPAHPNVLIAYTDTNATPSAYTGAANQALIFTLTTDPHSDQYTFDINQSIDQLSTIQIAGLVGGQGGIGDAVYVTSNSSTNGYSVYNDISKIPSGENIAFTLTARDQNGNMGRVNGTNNGFGVDNPSVSGNEVLIVNYSEDAATASFNFTGATSIYFKAYDEQGNLIGEGNITSGQIIQNLGSIGYIELSALAGTSFQFTGTTAQTIVSSTQNVDLHFDVTVTDSDGDTNTGGFNIHLEAPNTTPIAPVALTTNAIASLNEADLQAGAPDMSVQTLSFKSGSNSIGSFQFGDFSNISVTGINAHIHWAVNTAGQLIGTVFGREALRLTLDWDRINAGEQGDVTVTAELLTNLPHSVNVDSLTINGIKVVAIDGAGNTAQSTVTVTVADDVDIAKNDTAQLDVVVDSFKFSGVVANWQSTIGGTNITKYDGPDNDTGLDQIRWGDPSSWYGNQSGYGFMDNDAGLNGALSLNQDIVLGTFTHYNYSITSGTSITAATMKVTFNVTDAYGVTTPVTLTLNFSHNETPNTNDPIASRDIVTVGQTSVTFNYEGQIYTMQVIGFKDTNGNVVTSIYTNEDAATSYELVVRMVAGNGYSLPNTEGNVLTNDVVGADGPLTIIGVAKGDFTNTGGVSGQVGSTITGLYGTLILNADGTYKYQLTANASQLPTTGAIETFTYTIRDSDGDVSSATLKINVNPVNSDGINIADANLITTQGSSLNDTMVVVNGESANNPNQKILNVSFGGGQSGIITNSNGKEVVASGANNKSYSTTDAQFVNGGDGNDHIETGKGNDVIYAGRTGSTGYGSDDALELSVNTLLNHHIMTGELTGANRMVDSNGLLLANDVASHKADIVNGGSGDDRIYGQSGSDILYGHTGNDYIDGGSHNDALRGGEGNDTLIGGLGDDVLRGDSGADTFVWRYAEFGTDHIMDFKVTEDKLDLSDLLQGESANNLDSYLNFSLDSTGSTVIDIDANLDGVYEQHIILDGVNLFTTYGATNDAGVINGLLGTNGNGPLIIDTQPITPETPQGVTPLNDPHNNGTMIP
ncbi:putative outer membrane adhesin like proteiin [Shewanella sp. W3-18-1]|uniref:retention module-containing protein n=1 Tax=Shewanella sp. (strain W3-18-1) TaxID=351745 RepID=UPI0000ECFB79|nr:retention module-containing protein [Shewanella sp. W3-18-1]ABM26536.1 putative outer membrane adhesin like proteiin [Shewanella sp. W3-18-1]